MNVWLFLKKFPVAYRAAQDFYPYVTLFNAALRGKRGWKEHVKSTWSRLRKNEVIKGRPMNITIEPTNACNLLCPICETGANILEREEANMTLDEFQVIMNKLGPYTNTLMYYFMTKFWAWQAKIAMEREGLLERSCAQEKII